MLNDNFLRVAIAIKNKAYMWFWKHSALPMPQQEPPSPMDSPVKSFVKNKVSVYRQAILLKSFTPCMVLFHNATIHFEGCFVQFVGL